MVPSSDVIRTHTHTHMPNTTQNQSIYPLTWPIFQLHPCKTVSQFKIANIYNLPVHGIASTQFQVHANDIDFRDRNRRCRALDQVCRLDEATKSPGHANWHRCRPAVRRLGWLALVAHFVSTPIYVQSVDLVLRYVRPNPGIEKLKKQWDFKGKKKKEKRKKWKEYLISVYLMP